MPHQPKDMPCAREQKEPYRKYRRHRYNVLTPEQRERQRQRRARRQKNYIDYAWETLTILRDKKLAPRQELGAVFQRLRCLDPSVFEELVLNLCEEQGFTVIRNEAYIGDGGFDGRFVYDGKLFLIQAKRYTGFVQAKHVYDFDRVINAQRSRAGLFVHTGRKDIDFNRALERVKNPILVLSGQDLVSAVLHPKQHRLTNLIIER